MAERVGGAPSYNYLDYIPFVSTGVNLYALMLKAEWCYNINYKKSHFVELESISSNQNTLLFKVYLIHKSIGRTFVALIPLIGNIALGIFDLLSRLGRKEVFRVLR